MGKSYTPFDTAKLVLGSLCKRGHDYEGTGQSLRRFKNRYCVECDRAKAASKYAANPEAGLARNAAWRAANPEKHRANAAAWCAANPDRRRANAAAYRAANRESARVKSADWRASNPERCSSYYAASPEKYRAKSRRRRDRKSAATALEHITVAEIIQRKKDFSCACAFCGTIGNLHLDHFLPLSMGNALTLGNAIPACQRCNCSKHNSDPWDWYSRQPFFSQKHWKLIMKVLGKVKHHHGQMTFA
jgi:5-methylcytosine-specific restriction endonuclease McrA